MKQAASWFLLLAVFLCGGAQAAAPVMPYNQWVDVDPENTLIIDTTKGRLYVALYPQIAPKAVERIKLLARRGTYDGLLFHRVVPAFVAQTGDPGNVDGGKTELPNLAAEFTFRLKADMPRRIVGRPWALSEGFIGAMPYISLDEARMDTAEDHTVKAWGAHCDGVMGMGRDAGLDTANSEIYFMLAAYPALDHDYTAVGRILYDGDTMKTIARGEPPASPDAMVKVQVMADLPEVTRPKIHVLDIQGSEFGRMIDTERAHFGADFSVCNLTVPVWLERP